MRLRSIQPAFPEALTRALEDCGIRTDTDLLFSATPLQIYEKLPQGTVTLLELEGHVHNVLIYVSALGVRADLSAHSKRSLRRLSRDAGRSWPAHSGRAQEPC